MKIMRIYINFRTTNISKKLIVLPNKVLFLNFSKGLGVFVVKSNIRLPNPADKINKEKLGIIFNISFIKRF